jgi:hypothetical protein
MEVEEDNETRKEKVEKRLEKIAVRDNEWNRVYKKIIFFF